MMSQILYADSSVLVKRHVQEIGSNWFQNLAAPSANNVVITAALSIVEVLSAFNRRQREASISQTDYAQIAHDFLTISNNEYHFVQLTKAVIAESQRLLETYPLRAGDAVQLASAVLARTALQNAKLPVPIFLASDDKLLDAAQAEQLTIDNPLLHP